MGLLHRQIVACAGDSEAAVFYALGGDECIGEFLHGSGPAAGHDDLEAIIVVEVYVQRRYDDAAVAMLQIGERFLQVALVMVKNEGDGASNFLIAVAASASDRLL